MNSVDLEKVERAHGPWGAVVALAVSTALVFWLRSQILPWCYSGLEYLTGSQVAGESSVVVALLAVFSFAVAILCACCLILCIYALLSMAAILLQWLVAFLFGLRHSDRRKLILMDLERRRKESETSCSSSKSDNAARYENRVPVKV